MIDESEYVNPANEAIAEGRRGRTVDIAELARISGYSVSGIETEIQLGLPLARRGGIGRPHKIDTAQFIFHLVKKERRRLLGLFEKKLRELAVYRPEKRTTPISKQIGNVSAAMTQATVKFNEDMKTAEIIKIDGEKIEAKGDCSLASKGEAGCSSPSPEVQDGNYEELDVTELGETHKNKLMRVKARTAEIELARLEGKLVEIETVERVMTNMVSNARARFLTLPTRVAPQIAVMSDVNDVKKLLESVVYEGLNELSQIGPDALLSYESAGTVEASDQFDGERVVGSV